MNLLKKTYFITFED